MKKNKVTADEIKKTGRDLKDLLNKSEIEMTSPMARTEITAKNRIITVKIMADQGYFTKIFTL